MASQLEQLKHYTTVVADTGDFQSIQKFQPQDATTNPSLVYQATRLPQYQSLVEEAIQFAIEKNSNKEHLDAAVEDAMDKLFVNFGVEILKIVKGRVSTEIDARFSFDTKKTVEKALKIIALYEQAGIAKERVLIKIASTWEGTVAAKELEAQGIHVNMTLMFSKIQALAAAQFAKATLISPFVGRILDWYKEHDTKEQQAKYLQDASQDPGVKSVKEIYEYYKKFDIPTVIMGASFRNKDEITELAGIDLLTISPSLLKELDDNKTQGLEKKLNVEKAKASNHEFVPEITENMFRWELNENAMATEKLAEGIRKFAQDTVKLEQEVRAKIQSHFK